MPKSEFAFQVDEIQRTLAPTLKTAGFRKRGRTYNRSTLDNLVHVVNLQMGASDPPGTTYIKGLRENLHGLLTVNLGVYIPEVAQRHGGGLAGSFVQEYQCALRARLGNLSGQSHDVWWRINDPSTAENISSRLEGDALPLFSQLATRDDVLRNWPKIKSRISEGASYPWRIVAAIVLAERGDRPRARELLREQSMETHNPRHPEYVRQLARDIGAVWEE